MGAITKPSARAIRPRYVHAKIPYRAEPGVLPAGYQMIHSIEIKNFKGFKNFKVDHCNRVNVIVGDNGVGKTALLEAIFLALSATPEKAIVLRQWRGLDGAFGGAPQTIEDALYGDLFSAADTQAPVEIILNGDGAETRSLKISKGQSETRIPVGGNGTREAEVTSSTIFEWTDFKGDKKVSRTKISSAGIQFEHSGVGKSDCYFFPAAAPVPSIEAAARFSALSTAGQTGDLIRSFKSIFSWLDDLSIETIGALPAVHASVRGFKRKIPLTAVSGAINRIVAIAVAIAHQKNGVVLVDEVENGVYYSRQASMIRLLLETARQNDCQLFLSSHSGEWLSSLTSAAGKDVGDISLWRLEHDKNWNVEMFQFGGQSLKAGIAQGVEVRGGDE